jgi:protein-tyrosine-phosphatase/predicted transcriptional regulator
MEQFTSIAAALADARRLRVVAALMQSDMTAQELADVMQLQASATSYQLRILANAGLVRMHRSDADSRETYYQCDRSVIRAYTEMLGQLVRVDSGRWQAGRRVLFVCRANSARSQMAEAWVRACALPDMVVQSAGFDVSHIHPHTITVMHEVGVPLTHQHAKTIDAVDIKPDLVISVCDYARKAIAQRWPHAMYVHWSIPDPAKHGTTREFRVVRELIRERVEAAFGGSRFP